MNIYNFLQNTSNNIFSKFWYNNITLPLHNWWSQKIENLKINLIDLIELIALAIIISTGLKMFIYYNKEKDISRIYFTVVFYIILRLYWRVVLNV